MLRLLTWPIELAIRLIGFILSMAGRLMSLILGALICCMGAALCVTLVGLIPGVPLCIFGGGLMLKSIF